MKFEQKLLHGFLRLINVKKFVEKQFRNPARNTGIMKAKNFPSTMDIKSSLIDGYELVSLKMKNDFPSKGILFLHGGAYVIEAAKQHRKVMECFANAGFTVFFLDYPLAPENDYIKTHEILMKSYNKLVSENPNIDIHVFGDSAGGGLALSFLQVLRDMGELKPSTKTALASPWVDLSLENKKIKDLELIDPILSVSGLRYAAGLYAKDSKHKNPLVSPTYGNLRGLGNIRIYVGTHEIFYADCIEITEKMKNADETNCELVIGEGFIHDWIVSLNKDSFKTIDDIVYFFKN